MKVILEDEVWFAIVRYKKGFENRIIDICGSYDTIEEAEAVKDKYIKSTDNYCNCNYEYGITKSTYKKELV